MQGSHGSYSQCPHRPCRVLDPARLTNPATTQAPLITSSPGVSGIFRSFSSMLGKNHADLPKEWRRACDEEGCEYFYNQRTREISYDRPQPLPRDWGSAADKETGRIYYWHKKTKEVSWERPKGDGSSWDPRSSQGQGDAGDGGHGADGEPQLLNHSIPPPPGPPPPLPGVPECQPPPGGHNPWRST